MLVNLRKTDEFCDYVPVVSTISNLVDLFQKATVLPCLKKSSIDGSSYYAYLKQKSFSRCAVALIPVVGNILVGARDCVIKAKASSPRLESVSTKRAQSEVISREEYEASIRRMRAMVEQRFANGRPMEENELEFSDGSLDEEEAAAQQDQ